MNFKYYLGTYEKKNGTRAIRLKLETSKKDIQYIDAGISVLKTQWDGNRQKVKRHPLEENMNAELEALLNKVQKLHYDNKGITAKRLLTIYKNGNKYDSSSFLDFYQSIVDETRLKGRVRTSMTQQKYIEKLKKYSNHIGFGDLSVQFAKDYEKWMLKKGNKINTVASNFKSMNSILNKAVRMGILKTNPIKGYEITTENVEKESLTYEEILKLANMEIPDRFKGMEKARDMFLFSFYTAGMRFSDICRLEWKNIRGSDIVYTMGKSRYRAGSKRTIPLAPKAIEILDRYQGRNQTFVFPPLYGFEKSTLEKIEYQIFISNNNANRSLKIIDKKLGINKGMSMHMAKHSFTDFAVKNDVSILMISKLLGHTKLSTTQHYLKDFYHKEESAEINRLFGI